MSDIISRQYAIKRFGEDGTWLERQGVTTLSLVEAKQRAVDLLESFPSADIPKVERKSEELANMICDGICYYKEVTVDADSLDDLCEGCLIKKLIDGRPTGRWVRKEKEINDCDGHRAYYWYECDNCGARPPKDQWGHEWHSDFCPNCGSRNIEGDQE